MLIVPEFGLIVCRYTLQLQSYAGVTTLWPEQHARKLTAHLIRVPLQDKTFKMEFAIFDFYEEEAADIGKVSLISDVETMCITSSTFDYAQIVEVKWGGKICVARIVKFGGK